MKSFNELNEAMGKQTDPGISEQLPGLQHCLGFAVHYLPDMERVRLLRYFSIQQEERFSSVSRTIKLNGEISLKRDGISLTREKILPSIQIAPGPSLGATFILSVPSTCSQNCRSVQEQLSLQRYIRRGGKQFEWSLVQGLVQRGLLFHQLLLLGPAFLHLHSSGPFWLLPRPLCMSPVGPSSSPGTVEN